MRDAKVNDTIPRESEAPPAAVVYVTIDLSVRSDLPHRAQRRRSEPWRGLSWSLLAVNGQFVPTGRSRVEHLWTDIGDEA